VINLERTHPAFAGRDLIPVTTNFPNDIELATNKTVPKVSKDNNSGANLFIASIFENRNELRRMLTRKGNPFDTFADR
jgi:hypothetical protein